MNKKPHVSIKTYNKIMSLPDDKRVAVMACYKALGCDVEYLDEVNPDYPLFSSIGGQSTPSETIGLSFEWIYSKDGSKWHRLALSL